MARHGLRRSAPVPPAPQRAPWRWGLVLLRRRRSFQANHREEWLACLRKAFDGLARQTDGRIGEDQIVALLKDKLPEEEVSQGVRRYSSTPGAGKGSVGSSSARRGWALPLQEQLRDPSVGTSSSFPVTCR